MENGQEWPTIIRSGGNHAQRRRLITEQRPYNGKLSYSEFRFRYSRGCKLCENVHQGADAERFPGEVSNNVMLDLGMRIVVPNRYPILPLSMLWLPKNHDDMSTRVTLPAQGDTNTSSNELRPTDGKTRDAILDPGEVVELFEFSQSVGLVALRNHRLSGKSIHEHDHWQIYPKEAYPTTWFSRLVGNAASTACAFRAEGTPYDLLVLSDKSPRNLALRSAELLNRMEIANIIFSPYFIPGPLPRVLIAPLMEGSGDSPIKIGGGVQVHEIPDAESHARFTRYVPKRGGFNWRPFGVDPA